MIASLLFMFLFLLNYFSSFILEPYDVIIYNNVTLKGILKLFISFSLFLFLIYGFILMFKPPVPFISLIDAAVLAFLLYFIPNFSSNLSNLDVPFLSFFINNFIYIVAFLLIAQSIGLNVLRGGDL